MRQVLELISLPPDGAAEKPRIAIRQFPGKPINTGLSAGLAEVRKGRRIPYLRYRITGFFVVLYKQLLMYRIHSPGSAAACRPARGVLQAASGGLSFLLS